MESAQEVKNPIPIYALFTANAISLVGNVFSAIAIPWFVLQTTGSATQTGITGFFTIMPVVLAGFLGGTLIDRLGYKRTSIIADIASGITTALIPLLHFTIGLEFWQLGDHILHYHLQHGIHSSNERNEQENLNCLKVFHTP